MKVALTDVFVRDNNKIPYVNNIYVHCDVAGESIINGEQQSLLRMVHFVKKGSWTHEYNLPYYVNVNKSNSIKRIENPNMLHFSNNP